MRQEELRTTKMLKDEEQQLRKYRHPPLQLLRRQIGFLLFADALKREPQNIRRRLPEARQDRRQRHVYRQRRRPHDLLLLTELAAAG